VIISGSFETELLRVWWVGRSWHGSWRWRDVIWIACKIFML